MKKLLLGLCGALLVATVTLSSLYADYREDGAAGSTNTFSGAMSAGTPPIHVPACCAVAGTPASNSGSGTTGAVVATLAAVAAKTTYICGFSVHSVASAAVLGTVTVAGLSATSMVFGLAVPAASAQGAVDVTFGGCYPASAVNTAITVTTSALATGTQVNVVAWGYQL